MLHVGVVAEAFQTAVFSKVQPSKGRASHCFVNNNALGREWGAGTTDRVSLELLIDVMSLALVIRLVTVNCRLSYSTVVLHA